MNKQQIKYVIFFLSLVLLGAFVCDKLVFLALNRVSDKVKSGQSIGKLNHYLTLKDSVDLLMFGSSKVNHNINPSLIEKSSFNMGLNRRSIACASSLIKLLPRDKKQVVLLQVDKVDIFSSDYEGKDLEALLPKFHRISRLKNEIKKAGVSSWVNKIFWCGDYNGFVLSTIKNRLWPSYDYRSYYGYDPILLSATQKRIFKNEVESTPSNGCDEDLILTLNDTYLRYLREVSSFCEANNKVLITFSAPEYKDFCSIDNAEIQNLMVSEGIQFHDFTNSLSSNQNIEYWRDFGHLSHEGATVFSPIFIETIDSILATN